MTRRVIYADVATLARALLMVPATRRPRLAQHILTCANYAHRYAARLKKPHPRWGDGSVDAAARSFPIAAPKRFDDLEYCLCFQAALSAWMCHRYRHS